MEEEEIIIVLAGTEPNALGESPAKLYRFPKTPNGIAKAIAMLQALESQ